MANHNLGRLTEDIKREISASMTQLTDKRISEGFVTVTHVDLTSDLSYCKVMVSVMGDEEKTDEVIKVLQKAEGFFKKKINARIKMRKMPEIIFIADNSLDYYEKIDKIISKLPPIQEESEEDVAESGSETEE
ncbi:MAG: 30S ribosome-binding factor RbfA [Ruminococcaceae bacterium]|nr:30S ribosome-binding factor RbfA [Oscillospiraceae bacterium]